MKSRKLIISGTFILFLITALLSCTVQTDKPSMAPDFTLKNLDGTTFKFAETKGKVVLLDFWATWCPPCRWEMPIFQELYEKYKDDGLVVIGIALDPEGEKIVRPFIEKIGITFPIVIGKPSVVESYGNIKGIPTTFIIDREGKIVHKFVGAHTKEQIEPVIKKIIM